MNKEFTLNFWQQDLILKIKKKKKRQEKVEPFKMMQLCLFMVT